MTTPEQAFGLDLDVSPDADIASPMEAVVVLKYLDSDGAPLYIACATKTLMTVEAIGMLVYAQDFLRDSVRDDRA
jgi:hypothetical protein